MLAVRRSYSTFRSNVLCREAASAICVFDECLFGEGGGEWFGVFFAGVAGDASGS